MSEQEEDLETMNSTEEDPINKDEMEEDETAEEMKFTLSENRSSLVWLALMYVI